MALRNGIKALLHDRIIQKCEYHIRNNRINADDLEELEYLNKPYKFEELKPNMWVWDNVAKECLYVIKFFAAPFTGAKYFSYLGIYKNLEEIKKLDIKFEENRFFPVQCANLIKMGVKEDGTQKSTDD